MMATFISDVYQEEKLSNLQRAIKKNDLRMVQDLFMSLDVSENNNFHVQSVYRCAMKYGGPDVVETFQEMPWYKDVRLSALHIACLRNDIANAKFILQSRKHASNQTVSKSSENWPGFTPLHFAVAYRHFQIIELLLNYGADMNILDEKKMSPLCYAIVARDKMAITLLISHASKKNILIVNGRPLLHIACMLEDMNLVTQFLSGKLIYQLNMKAFTNHECYLSPEEFPVHRNRRYRVFHLSTPEWLDFTPLHVAARYNRIETAKLLVSKGARIDVVTCVFPDSSYTTGGMTALHVAHSYGHKRIVDLILQKHDGRKNIVDGYGLSQLHIACSRRNSRAIQKFLDHGAKFYKWRGQSLCAIALRHNRINNVKVLKTYNEADFNCMSRLTKRSYRIVKYLVDEKLLRLSEAQSILRISCKKGYLHIVKLLLEHGVTVNNCSPNHGTPLFYAIISGQLDIVKLLLSHWADPHNVMHDGRNALRALLSRPQKRFSRDAQTLTRYRHTVISWLWQAGMATSAVNESLQDLNSYGQLEDVMLLFEYGADVDRVIGSIESRIYLHHLEDNLEKMPKPVVLIYNHIIKLIIIGKHLSLYAELFFDDLTEREGPRLYQTMNEFRRDCKKECEELKRVKLNGDTSLHDVLLSEIAGGSTRSVSYQNLEEIIKSHNFETKYPLYGWLIRLSVLKERARSNLLESSKEYFMNLMENKLPLLCVVNILKYLTNSELRCLMSTSGVTVELDDSI